MVNPLVTVSVSSYNNSKYILETLDSINQQTYNNLELIIIDDCSTDNSLIIIDEWIKQHEGRFANIIIVNNAVNEGVCKVANQMVEMASGKYISLIASDDIMMPEKVRLQVNILEDSSDDVCAVYSDAHYIKEDSSPMYGLFIQRFRNFEDLPSGDLFDELLNGNFLPGMSLMFKHTHLKQIGDFDESLQYEDYDMWLRLARRYKFLPSNYVSVKYRSRMSSLTHTIRKWYPSIISIYLKHIDKSSTARKQLREIAQAAYYENDRQAIEVLRGANVRSKYIQSLLLLDKMPINRRIGMKLLNILHKQES